MTNDELAKLAATLSEAQRRAVKSARFWEGYGAYNPPGHYLTADRRVLRNLCRHKIVRDYLSPSQRLTPLGLALRNHLTKETPRAE